MKSKRFFVFIVIAFVVLNVIFIFSRSVLNKTESAKESADVKSMLQPFIENVLEPIFGVGSITDTVIRKAAHFIEFCSLGFVVGIISRIFERKFPVYGVLSVILVSLCDETIQLFSDRGSQIQDVWLDIFGAVVGISFAYFIIFLIYRRKHHKRRIKI